MARIQKMVICPKCGEKKIIENETEKKKKKKRTDLRAPTVADGLKMISAPLMAYISQFCGWWRP